MLSASVATAVNGRYISGWSNKRYTCTSVVIKRYINTHAWLSSVKLGMRPTISGVPFKSYPVVKHATLGCLLGRQVVLWMFVVRFKQEAARVRAHSYVK